MLPTLAISWQTDLRTLQFKVLPLDRSVELATLISVIAENFFYMVVIKIFIDNGGNKDWPSFCKGKNVSAVKWV